MHVTVLFSCLLSLSLGATPNGTPEQAYNTCRQNLFLVRLQEELPEDGIIRPSALRTNSLFRIDTERLCTEIEKGISVCNISTQNPKHLSPSIYGINSYWCLGHIVGNLGYNGLNSYAILVPLSQDGIPTALAARIGHIFSYEATILGEWLLPAAGTIIITAKGHTVPAYYHKNGYTIIEFDMPENSSIEESTHFLQSVVSQALQKRGACYLDYQEGRRRSKMFVNDNPTDIDFNTWISNIPFLTNKMAAYETIQEPTSSGKISQEWLAESLRQNTPIREEWQLIVDRMRYSNFITWARAEGYEDSLLQLWDNVTRQTLCAHEINTVLFGYYSVAEAESIAEQLIKDKTLKALLQELTATDITRDDTYPAHKEIITNFLQQHYGILPERTIFKLPLLVLDDFSEQETIGADFILNCDWTSLKEIAKRLRDWLNLHPEQEAPKIKMALQALNLGVINTLVFEKNIDAREALTLLDPHFSLSELAPNILPLLSEYLHLKGSSLKAFKDKLIEIKQIAAEMRP